MEGDVKNIRLLGQGHTVCARAWTDLRARRDYTLPGALRRHRRASQEDAQSRRAGGGGRGPLRNSGKIQERRYFFLGLFHWTGDYQAVRAVAGQVAVGAFPAHFAAGGGEPPEINWPKARRDCACTPPSRGVKRSGVNGATR